MRWRTDDEGSSTLVSFILATGVFAIAFTSVAYYASDQLGAEKEPGPGAYDAVAATAAHALMGSPGTADWELGPDPPPRWGLLSDGSSTTIDSAKIIKMRGWDDADYVEAKESLGLEDYEMRVRLYPRFTNPNGSVAGLGDHRVAYLGSPSVAVTPDERAAVDQTGVVFVNSAVDTDLSNGLSSGDVFDDTAVHVTRHLVPRLYGFPGAHDGTELPGHAATYWKIVDLASFGYTGIITPESGRVLTMSELTSNGQLWQYGDHTSPTQPVRANPDRILLTYVDFSDFESSTDTATFTIKHYHDGEQTGTVDAEFDQGYLEFYCISGCTTSGWQPNPLAAFRDDENGDDPDNFGTDVAEVFDKVKEGSKGYLALSWYAYDETVAPLVTRDAGQGWFIESMSFTIKRNGDTRFSWANDLVPDAANERIYDNLVVGSQMDQSVLNGAGNEFKKAVTAWVKNGGHVLVLGNDDPKNAWIGELVENAGTTTLGAGLYEDRTDHHHSILHNPFQLHYDSYNPAEKTYTINSKAFGGVVMRRILGQTEDAWLLSVPTSSWSHEGIVVFTAFQPGRMGPIESKNFFTNSFLYEKYYDLEVDFGRRVPPDAVVGSATRNVVVDARDFGLGHMEGELVMHVWR